MDDKDWLMLQVISEEKNITKTAERLYLSQPAISQRLKNLEREFGIKILHRNAGGVSFTSQGEYLLDYAKVMLTQYRDVKERILNMENTVQGTLRLGTSSIFAHYELPDILRGFREQYPQVEVFLKTGLSHTINRALLRGEISVAILRGDYIWNEGQLLLRNEPICLVSSSPIELNDLPNQPQISYKTDGPLYDIIQEWLRQSFSHPPLNPMEVDNMDTCRQMVLKGLGWAILPEIGLQKHDNLYTRALYWKNGKPLRRKTRLLYQHSSLELSVVKAFVDYISQCCLAP
ncbi:LysR family transcriptional regulator [Sporomusa acidovorans]|uniref:HTH-type transcriptional regulator YofA n=1 Tax=Sporomusa acidovorans (strain ATCC 49682 / DSM 3132 / Mol) TaxID=1123286 RepID=A0ABZ3IXX6_SPOA4|nr:LysR family transcriptional regulator [Sporomusa acidovorans]OZC15843.1 HTH-type transcriptional regulator YofA [Sporomusa acidovorans DSM 3132]SDF29691.1 DNA-binding transcriptional regulator, LysR family [Sporomusa acidovorans]